MLLRTKNRGTLSQRWAAAAWNAVSYRIPLPVMQIRLYHDGRYPVCPRCGSSFDREYTRFCDRCGQRLSWEQFAFATE